MTITLGADGHYNYLVYSGYGYLDVGEHVYNLSSPAGPIEGEYTYTKEDDDSGYLVLGDYHHFNLDFTSPTRGSQPGSSVQFNFELADLKISESAPALNISLRGKIGPGHPLIGGFVVPGPEIGPCNQFDSLACNARDVLIRVVGPSLAPFGAEDRWADPDFELHRNGVPAVQFGRHYSDWWTSYFTEDGTELNATPAAAFNRIFDYVGAFRLLERSKDAVMLTWLEPGVYTAQVSGVDETTGVALVEAYEVKQGAGFGTR